MAASKGPSAGEVKAARKERRLTQKDAAKVIGAGLRTWAGWEMGESTMSEAKWEQFLNRTKKLKRATAPTQGEKK